MYDDPKRYENDGLYDEDTDYEDEYEADDSDYIVDDEDEEDENALWDDAEEDTTDDDDTDDPPEKKRRKRKKKDLFADSDTDAEDAEAEEYEKARRRLAKEQHIIDKIPQMHLGAAACAIEKKGYRTNKGSRNRKIIFANCNAEIARLESELAYLSEERNKLNKEIIENIVGCPFSEMRMFHYTSDYIQAVEQELIKRGARCVRTKVDDVTDKVFFSATDAEIFTEVQNYLHCVYELVPNINGREASWFEMIAEYERRADENIKSHNNTPPEQKQDKPVKRHRSR